MIHTGLVSITFRKLTPRQIVDLLARTTLDGIEWGGDVHVPHGDLATAKEVRRMTQDAGRAICSYGSYYRAGLGEPAPFEAVLATAVELGAPLVRVWAGKIGSAQADAEYRARVVEDSARIADLAAQAGLTVAYEYHGNTLTDTLASTLELLRAAGRTNLKTYWQPRSSATPQAGLADLRALLPQLAHVHAYHWASGQPGGRRPLADGQDNWRQYFPLIRQAGGDPFVLIEFVKDDSPEAFLQDAAALADWQVRWGGGA